jgi:hypothetical protein
MQDKKRDAEFAARMSRERSSFLPFSRARTEIDKRLKKVLVVKNGMLVIHSQFGFDTYTVPLSSPWAVECGIGGFNVHFGAPIVERGNGDDAADVDPPQTAFISLVPFGSKDCETLGPIAGNAVREFLARASEAHT